MAKGTKTGGRANLRDAIMHAFDQVGGVGYLTMVARTHPQVFCALLGKVLPPQIPGADGDPETRRFTITIGSAAPGLIEHARGGGDEF